MKTKIHYIILEDTVLLSKKNYSNWKEIQDDYDDYKASLGPYSKEELIDYFKSDFKDETDFPISIQKIERFFNSDEYLLYQNGHLEKKDFHPKAPWYVENDEKIIDSIMRELEIEIHEKHFLYKKAFHIIGKREDRDDVALYLDNDRIIVFVHVTWKNKKESGCWPIYKLFFTKEELDKQIEMDNLVYEE